MLGINIMGSFKEAGTAVAVASVASVSGEAILGARVILGHSGYDRMRLPPSPFSMIASTLNRGAIYVPCVAGVVAAVVSQGVLGTQTSVIGVLLLEQGLGSDHQLLKLIGKIVFC